MGHRGDSVRASHMQGQQKRWPHGAMTGDFSGWWQRGHFHFSPSAIRDDRICIEKVICKGEEGALGGVG